MDGEIRRLYREQYDMYPSLTQEEVEVLYANEGICDKQASDIVREIEDEIRALNSERAAYLRTTYKNVYEEQIRRDNDLFFKIRELEDKKQNVIEIQRKLEESLSDDQNTAGLLSSIASIDEKINKLYEDMQRLNIEQQETCKEMNEFHRECEEKIRALKKELDKIKLDYATVFKQLYSSSRGLIKKNRIFPSNELRNRIVLGHLELAKVLAWTYFKLCDKTVEFDELAQIANEALMSAAHYYIPSSRATFKTYAKKCIENKLKRAIGEVKKEQKRRPAKPLDFIDEELRRIDYVMMFIDANKNVTNNKGERSFSNYFSLSPTGVQYKFKSSLLSYNREKRELGEYKSQLPGFKVIKSEDGLQNIMSIAMIYLKRSKIKALVSDDDIEMASMVAHLEDHVSLHEIYELVYILELYKTRLKNVRILLEAEIDLAGSADGIVPSDEEVLALVNQKIASENKGIYKAKHSSNPVSYKPLVSYYDLYSELWNVNLLAPNEFGESRAYEKRIIEADFSYFRNELICFYTDCYNDIIDSDIDLQDDSILLYSHVGKEKGKYKYFDFWDNIACDCTEERVLSSEQAIDFFKALIEMLKNMTPEEYVSKALKNRKQVTLEELKARNAKVIEGNKKLENTVRQQNAKGYARYWTIEQVRDASNWLTLLYESGLFVKYSDNHKTSHHRLSLEDEVTGNMFREDYLKVLDELPPLTKKVMLMYYDENGSHSSKAKEIASKLGIKERDVYREKDKALRFLRKSETIKSYLE